MRIVTVGASGFIGSHVFAYGRSKGLEMIPLSGIRVHPTSVAETEDPVHDWCTRNPAVFDRLCQAMSGSDVVINAAGRAQPGSTDKEGLLATNALQPAILARACSAASVRRFVHVGTASVQGRMDPLDESARYEPLSPYAASKAEGERLLLRQAGVVPSELVVYRPASVHGPARSVTKTLVRLSGAPAIPVSEAGDQPLPVALVDNVAAGIVFAASKLRLTEPNAKILVLHPSEDMTVRSLFECLGAKRLVCLPVTATKRIVLALRRAGQSSMQASSWARWAELLWLGQSMRCHRLLDAGFSPPVGRDGWVALGDEVRRNRGLARSEVEA